MLECQVRLIILIKNMQLNSWLRLWFYTDILRVSKIHYRSRLCYLSRNNYISVWEDLFINQIIKEPKLIYL